MGELLALRWRHVIWEAQRLHVQRAYTLGQEDSPKGRRGRTVPLAEQPAQALARLSQRPMFTRNSDLVFCSRTGEHLDGSALRRRFKAARDTAIAENPDMSALRFHEYADVFVMPMSLRRGCSERFCRFEVGISERLEEG